MFSYSENGDPAKARGCHGNRFGGGECGGESSEKQNCTCEAGPTLPSPPAIQLLPLSESVRDM